MARPLAVLLVAVSCVLGVATGAAAAGTYALTIDGGTGSAGSAVPGPVSASPLGQPSAMATDGSGKVWIFLGTGCRVVAVTAAGTLSVVAGNGTCGTAVAGSALSSPLSGTVKSLAVDPSGNLFIGDNGAARVFKVTPAGVLSVFAGNGSSAAPTPGSATSSAIGADSLATDSSGNLYVGWVSRPYVLKITAAGVLSIFTGNGTAGTTYAGLAATAQVNRPVSLAVDSTNRVYIGDAGTNRISRVSVNGLLIGYFAGTGASGTPVPGSTSSPVPAPNAMAFDSADTLYVAEGFSHQILSFTTGGGGAPALVAGTGGTGTPVAGVATNSPLGATLALAAPSAGTLQVADADHHYLLRVAAPTVPGAPTGLSAVPGPGSATLTFSPPVSDGGSAITGYQASTDGGTTWSALTVTGTTTKTGTRTGLINGLAYTVQVRAVNVVGTGAASASTTVTPATPPGVPLLPGAIGGDGTLTMAYLAPLSNGGSAITGYQTSTDGGVTWVALPANNILSGLTNGTAYTVLLRAVNAAGPGTATAGVTATPRGPPTAPTALSAVAGNRQAALTFTTPGDGGYPILGYQVSTDDGATWGGLAVSTSGTTNTATVTGLANGTAYPIRVRATNLGGNGAAGASVTVTPPVVPADAPTGLVVLSGSGSAALSFADPASTGGPVTGYEASSDNGVTWAPITVTDGILGIKNATVTGLTNGVTYAMRVRVVNAAGPGTASGSVTANPRGVPYAPTALSAAPGNRQLALTFTTPGDGGYPILSYQVSTDDGASWSGLAVTTSGTTNTGTVTGLTNGTTYKVRVRALSLGGTGIASGFTTVTLAALVPDAPTGLVVVPGSTTAALSFAAPAQTGGSPLTGYEVSTDNGTTWAPITVTDGILGIRNATVTGLTNGTAYLVQVRAVNAVGKGAATDGVSTTPRGVPYSPGNLTAVAGDRQATLTFTTPGDGGQPILGYGVSVDDGATWRILTVTTSGATNTGTVTGLTNGTAYPVRVRASNILGSSAPSATVVVTLPALAADAPTGLIAVTGDALAALSFFDPADTGGSPITGYEVTTDGVTWSPLTVTTGLLGVRNGTVTGLTNGETYPIQVRALTAAGPGAPSSVAGATPRSVPYAPTDLSAVPGNGQAVLTFTTGGDGGYAITGYQVSTDDGTTWATLAVSTSGTTNTGTATGLTNGTAYQIRVRAVNLAGPGVATGSATVRPVTVPGAPTGVAAAAGNTQATVTFTPPAATGGSPITGYQVSVDNGVTWNPLAANGIVTGLTNGTAYAVRVRAVNAVGPGTAGTAASVTPVPATPDPPTGLSAVRGDRHAVLTFTAPVMTGTSAITGYQVSTNDGATWATLAGDRDVTGLTNGTTYTVRVRAVNSSGAGPASGSTTVTPGAAPAAPGPLSVQAGDGAAVLTFTTPGDDGGDPITGYQVSADDGTTWVALAPDRTVTGLTNGTTYRFRVRAVNGVGPGPATAGVDATPATTPDAPTAVSATPGDNRAVVSFTPPAADGGAAITGYEVSTDDGQTWATLPANLTVTGLTNDTTYLVRVRAVNRAGAGPASANTAVTPNDGLPGAPTGLTALRGDRRTTLTFTAPANPGDSAISGYQVSVDGGATWAALAGNRTVTGLTNGTAYNVQVRAVNGTGAGPATASVPVTPATVPGTPTGFGVTRGDRSAVVTFTAPADDGGDPVAGYDVSTDDGGTWVPLAGDRIVTGLTNGTTYTVRVRARNDVGAGGDTAGLTVTPATGAGAPTGLTAQRGNGSATLTFTAPADDGGDPVTGYQVSADDGGSWAVLPGNRVVTGLTNGIAYTVRVRAVNSTGPGPASGSALVTPATAPGAPTGLSATAGDAQAVLMFTAPDDGGDDITGYEASLDDGTTWLALAVTGSGTAKTGTVTGLTDATTYTVRVRATNTAGTGPPSANTTVTPISGLPAAPTGLTAARGNGTVTLTYTPPTDPGNSPITGYDVSTDGGASWAALAGDGLVSGLTNGTEYTFWVRARNGAGPGPASASATATPATTPGAPGGLAATAGDTAITVTLAAPADDGGDPVTEYQVSLDDGASWMTLPANGTVTGLTNGTTYTVRVRALNGVGPGPAGPSVTVTPRPGVPGAPTDLTATRADRSVTLTFTPPADPGTSAVTGYDVSTDDGANWAPLAADGTVTGLSNGTAYPIRVRARNTAGPGPASAATTVIPAAVPGAPGAVSATTGDAGTTLTFAAPADDGGSPITGYQVSTDDGATWGPLSVTGSTTLTATVTGLSNGITYLVRVRARNAVGGGASSASTSVTPTTVPGRPTALTASAGDGRAALIFTAPGDDGGSPITGYQVSTDDGTTWAALAADRVVTGLSNDTTYLIRVRAVTATGPGPASDSATVTPVSGLPGAVTGLAVARGDSSATATFTPPANPGAGPITGYEVSTDDGYNWAPLAADGRILALTNGMPYTVRVRALNSRGSGPAGAAVEVTPAAVPGRPARLQAVAGDRTATLTFDPPVADGGSPITSYDVSTDDGATWVALPANGTVTGLTNGTPYSVRVRAVNEVGNGAASTAVTVTPTTTPGAPGNVTATPGDSSATIVFTAPADGGSPITSYEVSTDGGTTWATLPANGVVTGLTNGTSYSIRVRARTATGPGGPSAAVTVTPVAVPGAPTNLAVTPGDSSLSVTYTAPAAGGSPITGYQVSTDDGLAWSALAADGTVGGLTNGNTYTVRVRAVNAVGPGAAGTSQQATPRTVPGAPTGLTATPGDASLSLTFTPADDGGSAITRYEASSDNGTSWQTLAVAGSGTKTGTITGLSNATAYVVRVRARNAAGAGAASASASGVPVSGLPGAPGALTVTRDDGSAQVTFARGSGAVTGYQVSTDDGANWSALDVSGTATLTGEITGLSNGITYVLRVRAVNATGTSPPTAGVSITPATTPGAPTNLVLTPGDRSATVAFTAPAGDGGSAITSYEVTDDGGSTWSALPPDNIVTGLTNGTTSVLRVRARNSVGPGPASASRPVTPAAVPGAPTGVAAERGNGSATVTFTVAAGPVTGYEVSTDDGSTWSALGANGVVSGLSNGTAYPIRVRARNDVGAGPASARVTVTPATVPGTPADPSVAPGDASAAVTFTPPADGGDAITGYQVTTDGGTTWLALSVSGTGPRRTGIVTGLSNGTAYDLRVRARNSVGAGGPSTSVTVAPLSGLPPTPAGVSVAGGDASVTVTVDPATPPITGYEVSTDGGLTWAALPPGGRVTGLTNGVRYLVSVRALSPAGAGPASPGQAVTPAAVPSAPAAVTAAAGNASATLTVTAPLSDGGSAITSYEVSTNGGVTWAALAANRIVTGLANGTAYAIRVRAVNAIGAGAASAAVTVTPVAGLPAAPGDFTVTRGNESATVAFTAGAGDPSGYEVTTDGGSTWTVLAADRIVTGLTNGTGYVIAVRAVNTAGAGPATTGVTVTPATTPGAPDVVSVVFTGTTATISFTAPTGDGGSAITGYDASLDGGTTWAPVTATGTGPLTATVSGLTAGTTYSVVLRARNAVGPGPASPEYALGVPSAPTAVAVSRNGTTATVTYTGPDDDSITGYEVSLDDGTTWVPVPAGGVLTGLDATRTYVVRIRAVNAAGAGRPSAAVTSNPLPPGAPSGVRATAGTSSILVTWAPPATTPVPVTGYRVVAVPGPATCETGPDETSCVLGATAGVRYTVRVLALAEGGLSTSSAASAAVTPIDPAVPSAPPVSAPALTTSLGDITEAAPGARFELVGTGFAPYSTVTIVIYSTPRLLGTITTDADGAFRKTVTIPADLTAGRHTFLATGVDPDGNTFTRTLTITVQAAVPTPAPTPTPTTSPPADDEPSRMPTTGANIAMVAALGLLLIAAGAALLLIRRRKTD